MSLWGKPPFESEERERRADGKKFKAKIVEFKMQVTASEFPGDRDGSC